MNQPVNIFENGYEFNFQEFEDKVYEATAKHFADILASTDETIYILSLYCLGDCPDFMHPAYNTEEYVASACTHRQPDDPLTDQQRAITLRWHPGEFGYHEDGHELVTEIRPVINKVTEFAEKLWEQAETEEDDELAMKFNDAIEQRLVQVLKRVAEQDFIQQYWRNNQTMLINLLKSDQSHEEQFYRARIIGNPQWLLERYEHEIQEGFDLTQYKYQNPVSP